MKRYLVPLIFGLGGFAILASFGVWQMQRHEWKQGVLAEIEAKIGADPVSIPASAEEHFHKYLPVTTTGSFDGGDIAVLTSVEQIGAAYRLIAAFKMGTGQRILVDRGIVPVTTTERTEEVDNITITGNLHWPDETDGWTPEPDLESGIYYARDVATLAAALGTDPILVVAKSTSGGSPVTTPMPVGTEGIPNNHWGYAIQWFGLALVWLGMTVFLLWRIHRRTV